MTVKCEWCKHSRWIRGDLKCHLHNKDCYTRSAWMCDDYEREPGADDCKDDDGMVKPRQTSTRQVI